MTVRPPLREQIERWWIAHRGPDWRAGVRMEPVRFPPDVNPYAPPTND